MAMTPDPAVLQTFMVVATIHDDINPAEMAALGADEERRLAVLHADGRVGAHHIARARRTAFLEVIAADEAEVEATLATLPFNQFFDPNIYLTATPGGAEPAPRPPA